MALWGSLAVEGSTIGMLFLLHCCGARMGVELYIGGFGKLLTVVGILCV